MSLSLVSLANDFDSDARAGLARRSRRMRAIGLTTFAGLHLAAAVSAHAQSASSINAAVMADAPTATATNAAQPAPAAASPQAAATPPANPTTITAGWQDGFFLQSANGDY